MNHRSFSTHACLHARSPSTIRVLKKPSQPSRVRWRCHLPLLPAHPRWRSFPWKCACKICIPGTARAAGNSRKALVELRATKEAPREPFPVPAASCLFFVPATLQRRSPVTRTPMYPGLQVENWETNFLKKTPGRVQ